MEPPTRLSLLRPPSPLLLSAIVLCLAGFAIAKIPEGTFRFDILGDRTGEAVPGVYRQALKEAAADHPSFIINVGDSIQGEDDKTVDEEWRKFLALLQPYRRFPFYFTPGNHDVWSPASAEAYEKYTKHALHYSFDYGQAHFVVLDDSRSDVMPPEELAFLKRDLELHNSQPLKFVFSHRPSWILNAVLGNSEFTIHRLARQYGVQFVIAGHIHQMLSFQLDNIRYLSMASSGGHLRASKRYQDGWFFAHTLVTISGKSITMQIKELQPPFGQGRVTGPADWGVAGLSK